MQSPVLFNGIKFVTLTTEEFFFKAKSFLVFDRYEEQLVMKKKAKDKHDMFVPTAWILKKFISL